MKSKIVVTTIYNDPKYENTDSVINEFYEDEYDKDVSMLIYALDGFVANLDIFRSKEEKLKKYLRSGNYKKYYSTIEKMVKKAKKEFL